MSQHRNISRRECLVAAARWTAVGLLVGGGSWLVLKPAGNGSNCPRPGSGLCGGCDLLGACGLPQAIAARQGGGKE